MAKLKYFRVHKYGKGQAKHIATRNKKTRAYRTLCGIQFTTEESEELVAVQIKCYTGDECAKCRKATWRPLKFEPIREGGLGRVKVQVLPPCGPA